MQGQSNTVDNATIYAPSIQKIGYTQPDFRVVTQGMKFGVDCPCRDKTSGKDYVSLSISAPEFGPKKFYANLGKAAKSEGEEFYALIWNPED